ncbi:MULTISPECIES: sigma-70 family RNA polymerase sigma factor [Brevibacillus]|uniref:sigma-70 family RNA polymerase sigma factor n=1 Tax=Brevibacillus TaxID=55080 RepID=UPI0004F2BFCA|nr:sigma-70 family RNA polymerase sigma factor [Brevibacillus borstelensis]KKX52457.1 hypothetical protein X546_25200 [Brevibacillus borstelensis cifa_chp40]MBE5395180.1 sigma-70 family RNA polymerase sigma factor [Brevibacillus borstelensis]MED1876790.1 sigma-70 family RNA polymerase sigma factor [Brevibacillus borstelensis]WNF05850.1 sigma-70 family RNA polymerase sigma factor [Brevibacillus borstelensis]
MEINLLRDNAIRNNKVIKLFLEIPENKSLYDQVIESKHNENALKELNKRFVDFYLEIRLVKYISTIIHNSVIELDLRSSKKEKSLLPYDETIHDKHFSTTNTAQDTILDNKIPIECFKSLTKKEKNIIYFIFYKELKEAEIARYLNISQQAVSKTKRRALQKIREELKKEEQR